MKKTIIAMAVAGALAVPAIASADATLYGNFRVGVQKADNQTLDVFNGSSRIGVKGTVDLGLESTVGIYQWEAGFAATGTNAGTSLTERNTFAGASGNWGTLIAGRIDHPTLAIEDTTDIGSIVFPKSKPSYSDGSIIKTVAYVSPSMGGLTATVGGVFAGQSTSNPKENIDGYNLGVDYSIGDLGLKAAYGQLNTNNALATGKQDKMGLAATYKLDALALAAYYSRVNDKSAATTVKDQSYGVSGKYGFGEGLSVGLAYSTSKLDNADRRKTTQLELAQALGRGAISTGYIDRNSAQAGEDTFYVGYRLNF